MNCPNCGSECWRDSADVGIGVMLYGPWGCPCGWSESPEFDLTGGPRYSDTGYRLDQWGGATPVPRGEGA